MKESNRALIQRDLRLPEGRLLLAFSGGSDSLFLMYLLSLYARDRSSAVYIDHKIRSKDELVKEKRLNIENAKALAIPLNIIELDEGEVERLSRERGSGLEAAARELRYKKLEEYRASNGYDFILTAHHREDQIETILMRILSSSPFYTFSGIRERDGYIVRPILSIKKDLILSVLEESGLRYSEDSTNSDTRYLRNRIRHSLSKALSERQKELLLSISENVSKIKRKEIAISGDHYLVANRGEFLSSMPWDQDDLLFRAFGMLGIDRRVKRTLLRDIKAKASIGSSHIDAMGITIIFTKSEIKFYRDISISDAEYIFNDMSLGPLELRHDSYDEKDLIIDERSISGKCVLRRSRVGDRISLKGGSKLVSDLEGEMHVPFSLVLEDERGIIAYFSRFLGGRDRLSKRMLGLSGRPFRVVWKEK